MYVQHGLYKLVNPDLQGTTVSPAQPMGFVSSTMWPSQLNTPRNTTRQKGEIKKFLYPAVYCN